MKLATIFQSMRPSFLVLTPVCVFLGWSVAIAANVQVSTHLFIFSLIGALFAHISANTLNEYLDFKSGLDLKTIKTKFSGGSGALPATPEMAAMVFWVGVFSLLITLLLGVFFIWTYSWAIFPLGIIGALLIALYTSWVNKHPFVCLIAPGAGFGLLMVEGGYFALTGEYSPLLWLVGLVPFFLINNLLLLNQYPDIKADKGVGRNHFPIAYGIKASNSIYCLFVLMSIIIITYLVMANLLPTLSMIALLPMPFAFYSLYGAIKHGEKLGAYPQFLATNVIVAISSPALLAVTIIYG